MAIPDTYKGNTWRDLVGEILAAAAAAQGSAPGPNLPILTNQQALSILQAFKSIARKHSVTVPFWPELWYALLGQAHPNDRFLMTAVHAAKQATDANLEATWAALWSMADTFDKAQITGSIKKFKIDQSWSGYRQAARDAWLQLQKDRLKDGVVIKPPPIRNPFSGAGTVLVIALLLYAISKQKG